MFIEERGWRDTRRNGESPQHNRNFHLIFSQNVITEQDAGV